MTDKLKVFEFLDGLRDSGIINMFGAAPYIQAGFPGVDAAEARKLLAEWIQTFTERHVVIDERDDTDE